LLPRFSWIGGAFLSSSSFPRAAPGSRSISVSRLVRGSAPAWGEPDGQHVSGSKLVAIQPNSHSGCGHDPATAPYPGPATVGRLRALRNCRKESTTVTRCRTCCSRLPLSGLGSNEPEVLRCDKSFAAESAIQLRRRPGRHVYAVGMSRTVGTSLGSKPGPTSSLNISRLTRPCKQAKRRWPAAQAAGHVRHC